MGELPKLPVQGPCWVWGTFNFLRESIEVAESGSQAGTWTSFQKKSVRRKLSVRFRAGSPLGDGGEAEIPFGKCVGLRCVCARGGEGLGWLRRI